jgi:NAD(P)-dependent dehydrogenase (short-subunit alcohol dehydrogenase family)
MPPPSSFLDFGGRWVVVSGASSGIGRAIAQELSRHGAGVVLVGRNAQALAQTAQSIGDAPTRTLELDLRHSERIAPAIAALRAEIGPLYGLCHAAGVVQTKPLANHTPDVLRDQLELNLVAGVELTRAVCRRDTMLTEGGSVLFIASVYAHAGAPGQIGYCASKGAVLAAVRALAVELARRRVRVNSLSPGLVHTEMTRESFGKLKPEQMQRIEASHPLGTGQPEDVARAAVFMLSPGTRWITGADLAVDGGYTAQ